MLWLRPFNKNSLLELLFPDDCWFLLLRSNAHFEEKFYCIYVRTNVYVYILTYKLHTYMYVDHKAKADATWQKELGICDNDNKSQQTNAETSYSVCTHALYVIMMFENIVKHKKLEIFGGWSPGARWCCGGWSVQQLIAWTLGKVQELERNNRRGMVNGDGIFSQTSDKKLEEWWRS